MYIRVILYLLLATRPAFALLQKLAVFLYYIMRVLYI